MAARCPWALLSPAGSPWARWDTRGSRCPAVPDSNRNPEKVEGSGTGAGAQTEPGAEKNEGKTHEKTNPLLWLLLLMRSRALPEAQGTEGGLSRAALSLQRQFPEPRGQSPAGCCSWELLFLESRAGDGHRVGRAAEASGGDRDELPAQGGLMGLRLFGNYF